MPFIEVVHSGDAEYLALQRQSLLTPWRSERSSANSRALAKASSQSRTTPPVCLEPEPREALRDRPRHDCCRLSKGPTPITCRYRPAPESGYLYVRAQ